MKNITSGIQIIGTQRSGSNLLRVMLDQSPYVTAPHPPHILSTFLPLMPLYGNMDEQSYASLVSDVVDFVHANPVVWNNITLNKEDILVRSVNHNIYEAFKRVYETAAISQGAQYWCCKSMVNVHFAGDMEANGIHPKYIFLYRDGRDMAVSFKKAVVGEKHAYHLARQWKHDQEACLQLKKNICPERFYSLCYEDLIAEPRKQMNMLCEFLNIPYQENMLDFYTSKTSIAAAAAGQMWVNLTKPVIRNNSGKFLTELPYHELEVFEMVAGETLIKLGYQTVTGGSDVNKLSVESIQQYDLENSMLKQRILINNPADMEKRKAQSLILKSIRERGMASKQTVL
jgi:hypothetical protein